jgi:hypothetical protein
MHAFAQRGEEKESGLPAAGADRHRDHRGITGVGDDLLEQAKCVGCDVGRNWNRQLVGGKRRRRDQLDAALFGIEPDAEEIMGKV